MKLGFAFRLFLQNIRASRNLNILSIGIITFSFLILGLFMLASRNLELVVEKWGEQIQVVVFLSDSVKDSEIKNLERELRGRPEIKSLAFVNKDQAMDRLRNILQEKAKVLEGMDKNPLPASIELQLDKKYRNLGFIQAFAKELSGRPEIEQVFYGQNWLKNFLSLYRIFRMLTFAIGGLIFLASAFIVYNTVKLTVYSRREEIGIMKLVGATDSFIRIPFLLEGLTQAVSASVLALFLLWVLWFVFHRTVQIPFQLFALSGISFLSPNQALAMIAAAATLGILGSMVSFQEFLRV
jgi:cell division transport system permease protein